MCQKPCGIGHDILWDFGCLRPRHLTQMPAVIYTFSVPKIQDRSSHQPGMGVSHAPRHEYPPYKVSG